MRFSTALLGGLAAAVLVAASPATDHPERRQEADLQPASTEEQLAIYQQAFTDPVGAANAARNLPYMAGQYATGGLYRYNLAADNGQLPWNTDVYFQPEAAVNGSDEGGWQSLPEIPAFDLNRTWTVRDEAIMPFYQSKGYDASQVKRAVIVMPGKPRDCWKYTSLVQNALSVAALNETSGVTNSSVLILGPCWLNTNDQQAGAVGNNELYWTRSQWQRGALSQGPGNLTVSTYRVMDGFLEMLFDKAQFPALNRVVVAGHSMGAQMVQRYAMLKDPQPFDANVEFWIGNPGSVVWPVSSRPFANASCAAVTDWPYGLDNTETIPVYARSGIEGNTSAYVDRYRSRKVHLNLGLLDNGQGDTSCEAATQGANHLERGCELVQALADMPGGFPQTHTVNLMPNVSHVDYSMLSYNISLWRLFADGLDTQEAYTPASSSRTASGKGGSGGGAARTAAAGVASRPSAGLGLASLLAVTAGGLLTLL